MLVLPTVIASIALIFTKYCTVFLHNNKIEKDCTKVLFMYCTTLHKVLHSIIDVSIAQSIAQFCTKYCSFFLHNCIQFIVLCANVF